MYYSKIFAKTRKTAPHDADSQNAKLLVQAGFIDQQMAGVYSYLPLGLRVLDKVKDVVRDEMNKIDGQEILMPALLGAEPWKTTGRWDDPGDEVMFQFKGRGDKDFGLGWTHEEIVTPLVQKFVNSYKDLPVAVYQIQDKFRNEPRAKSGILRGREFSMKDLYSFHATEEDLHDYYEKSKQAYLNIFKRCGLDAKEVNALGGDFSKYSHEFQIFNESGEDTIYYCNNCGKAWNKELETIEKLKEGEPCKSGNICVDKGKDKKIGTIRTAKAIEVGNIFKLKTRFTEAFKFNFTDEDGEKKPVLMGCYGIGPSRVMGSVVEVHHDDNGMLWPKAIAPYHVHIVMLGSKDESVSQRIEQVATSLHDDLEKIDIEVLCDDRAEASAGEKFADADLIGIPLRIIVSEKTLAEDSVEWKERTSSEQHLTKLESIVDEIKTWVKN